ncbi:glycosyltransferase [Rothia sp. ZJ1223]|uniref:glycosyltransferase n=1 Tax=Rothia sp. ZJ1223 TaxID=2811098 RepID=UPI00195B2AE0|nr:glycosyltransferase [Rothia sp. ZJ1223]MBM7051406.1 glycosyltransferase [Rothia sp. ZJ1223]
MPVPDFAGVARHLVDIARNGIEGFDLVFFCPEGELAEHLRTLDVDVRVGKFGPDFGFVSSCKALQAIISEVKPDLVHTHLAYADVIGVVVVNALKLLRRVGRASVAPQLISTEHGIAVDDLVYHGTKAKSVLMENVHRVRLWFTDGKIAVSQFNAVQMKRKWGARGVTVIPNGVDLDVVTQKVADARVAGEPGILRVVSMARLAPEKKIDVLIDAFALALKSNSALTLEIAGKGGCIDELQEQVENLKIGDSVNFSGFSDPFEVMGRNDLLVQLSIAENNSYTLLEAKAGGLQVIATAMGGNPEQLEDAEMVPALTAMNRQEIVESAAQKILEVASGKKLGSSDFSWSTTTEMTQRIAQKYTEVL